MKKKAKAFAPASVANVGVGFDLLGFSFDALGDYVTVEKISEPKVILTSISGVATSLPLDPSANTATAGLVQLLKDRCYDFGLQVTIEKGIPLGSGLGGSAASAVAALVAMNALLESPLSVEDLLGYALLGEAQSSGSFHADNLAPSLLGGLVLSRVREHQRARPVVEITSIPVVQAWHCVVFHPDVVIETKKARGILKPELSMKTCIEQSGNLAGFIAGCFLGDESLIKSSLNDVWIEPQRQFLIPRFAQAKEVALEAGALGFSISGAGPSLFAWARSLDEAKKIELALKEVFKETVKVNSWIRSLHSRGARLVDL